MTAVVRATRGVGQVQPPVTPAIRLPASAPRPVYLRVVDEQNRTRNACQHCALNGTCLPASLVGESREAFTNLIFHHKHLQAGQALFHVDETFHNLYFVKTGSLKSMVQLDDGRGQVTGFHLVGDVLGVDAISFPTHPSEAIALEGTYVCAIPFVQLSRMSQRVESLQTYVQRLLARELVRDQGLLLLLGRMQADERVATFLIDLSKRFAARGYSPLEFTLPMAREEIGNYLGLTLETVSRCFSRLKSAGVLRVDNRHIRILNLDALQNVIGGRETVH